MASIIIDGYADSDKVPQFVGQVKFGAGPINIRSIPLVLLLVGLKGTGGSMTADVDVLDVTSKDDGTAYAGVGELSNMVDTALDQGLSGVQLKIAAPALAGGAVAATSTITITGTATGAGTLRYWVDGTLVDVNTTSSMTTPTLVADAITARFAQFPRLPVSVANVAGVVTITVRSAGIRGNDYVLFQDTTKGPPGITSAITGGASVTGGGVKFTGGTGTESLTLLLAVLFPARYHRIAFAQNDATSLAAIETQIDAKAGGLEGRREHVVVGHNGSLGAATTIAQTTLNNQRFQLCWLLNSESHPSRIGSAMAGKRASVEQTQPNSGYDDVVLKGIAPQRARGDWASRTTQQSALDNGVTPLKTTEDGTVAVVRAITTRSRDGAMPDYRTLDTAESVVPDYAMDRFQLVWTTEYKVANPHVQPDPGEGEGAVEEGVATPFTWTKRVKLELQSMQTEKIVTQVALAANQPVSEFNAAAKRIMSAIPIVPLPIQHSIGVVISQVAVAA